MEERILIVEDAPRLREIMVDYFCAKGALPVPAENGREALNLLEQRQFDAVLLDIMMPEVDGFQVCRRVRRDNQVPIIFLTALSDEEDKLLGYALGADDYITKPFSLAVLYAKTMALISRSRGAVGRTGELHAGNVTLYLGDRTARIDGELQSLPNREFQLLRCLMEHRNQVLTRDQLLNLAWGYDYEGDARTVDTHVKRLRARGVPIETVIRVGYRFREEVEP